MATSFESIYTKFLDGIDDYELGLISDDELNNVCFRYLEKARAMYFPQCTKDLDDVTIQRQSEIDALNNESSESNDGTVLKSGLELEEKFVVDRIIGRFNFDLTNQEQYILALGMKKSWLSSKKYSADLMVKDVGDRDYKAVQGFNYLKELSNLDEDLEEEIRKYAVGYTYSIDELSSGW